jgi:alpha-D-ribose 1-methylphosphonate 5-triphosphate synthase subunit PhnH
MNSLSLLPAFTDEATDSQIIFRNILKAMSEPGTIIDIDRSFVQYNRHYSKNIHQKKLSYLWSIAQTLLDSDCLLFICPSISDEFFLQSLAFYTGVNFTYDIKQADFIFMSIHELKDLNDLNCGDVEKPHLSSTALVYVDAMSAQEQIILSGPGIKESKPLALAGLDEEKISILNNNYKLYPCGMDFIFCSETSMTAIPRSTKIKNGDINIANINHRINEELMENK